MNKVLITMVRIKGERERETGRSDGVRHGEKERLEDIEGLGAKGP